MGCWLMIYIPLADDTHVYIYMYIRDTHLFIVNVMIGRKGGLKEGTYSARQQQGKGAPKI
jgi:hypothetical protein